EYGSYPRHDHQYIVWLRDTMVKEGFSGKLSNSDGASVNMLKDSTLPGVAVGLDSGLSDADWAVARKVNPGVPIFSGETYPGWLRHWGEGDWAPTDVTNELKFYMDNKKSFSLYLVHGGTNFGFNTGANHGGKGYEPDLTSYDYGCPISEQGLPTKEYFKYRETLQGYLKSEKLIDIPKPIPTMTIPAIDMKPLIDIWHTPGKFVQRRFPALFEELGQNQGLIRYEVSLPKDASGKLTFDRLSDYATIFVDGKYIGSLDRRLGQKEIEISEGAKVVDRKIEILVEGMGRINYSGAMDSDRKGISGVKLNGNLLSDWTMEMLPLEDRWVSSLSQSRGLSDRKGQFFRGTFELDRTADTFLDMRKYGKGVVWVNGHNLGRFWKIGPQYRLYCPAPWLKKGTNTITVFDMEGTGTGESPAIEGFGAMR
ncbi:MAG: beta-galactosidase, partial [Armatimonadota bacterium]